MVLVNFIWYSKLLEILPNNIIKILDTMDKFTDRNIMLENAKVDKIYWNFSIKKEDEALGLNRADLVLAIQKDEKEFFESICNKEVVLINHLEYENFIKPLHHKDKLIIGFIGSNNGSNISSINSFIDKFINLINISGLNIELQIAGKVCDHIKEQHKNIKKLYFLEDTTDFFKNIHLFVNPLTSGTGLKIKSVEALSYGVPIICFDGIESSSKFHKIENLDLMIEYIKEIIQNPFILDELSNKSKNIFEEYTKKLDKNISTIFNYDNDNTSKKNLSINFIKNYNTVQKYKIKYEILNYKYEINQNRTFSIWINKIYSQLDSFIEKYDKVIKDLKVSNIDEAKKYLEKFGVTKDKVEIWGTGSPRREFMWSKDMADACIFIMEKIDFINTYNKDIKEIKNTHINIGTGKDISIKELAILIKNIVGYSGELYFNIEKPDGTILKRTDVSKLDKLGWKYKIELEEGVKRIYEWYKNER